MEFVTDLERDQRGEDPPLFFRAIATQSQLVVVEYQQIKMKMILVRRKKKRLQDQDEDDTDEEEEEEIGRASGGGDESTSYGVQEKGDESSPIVVHANLAISAGVFRSQPEEE
ncbi:hypothetical protein GW17_00043956 [Ensete ventricosum]|nr:hypothetical protein GW17_00043956 [Ensete ventricosum]